MILLTWASLFLIWVGVVLLWTFDWRRLAAVMLTRPLMRLGKWLDRGPRRTEAAVLRFKRELNRTVEQLQAEREGRP